MNIRPKQKILLLITKSNWGGAQRYVFDIATKLPIADFDVVVALGGNGPLVEKLQQAQVRVISIPGLQRNISFKKELLSTLAIKKVIQDEAPDILHVNSSKAGLIGAVLGRMVRVPKVIFTAHGWAFNEDRNFISRVAFGFFHWLTIMAAHQTIAVSKALRQQMRWPGTQKKMTVVHNGGTVPEYLTRECARSALCTTLPALTSYTNDYWSVTIGELHKTKQHHITIAAIDTLVRRGITIRHIIISGGQERAALEALITEKGLNNNVFLTGHLDNAASFLKAFDLFILASRSEALGYVILEAAQAALPIVASNVGGIPEIVQNNLEATLVPSADVEALAQAIFHLYSNPSLAVTMAHAANIKSATFNITTMIQQTIAVYQK